MAQPESHYKVVWISTAVRTGSMWLFNVTRAVLRCAGRTVLPERVPQREEQIFEMAQRDAWTDTTPGSVWVFKVHFALRSDLPQSRFITTIRDPRDVVVSYRRFQDTTFEHALGAGDDVVRCAELYRDCPPTVLLTIDYRDIEDRPRDVINRIGAFLEVPVAADDAARVAEEFSRERVRQRIESTTQSVLQRLQRNAPVAADEVVPVRGRIIRAYDVETGFQTGHLSDAPSGSWRTLLSEEEKRVVCERFAGFIAQHGFPKD